MLRNRHLEEKRVVTAARLTSAAGSRVSSKHKVGTSGTRALPGLIRIKVFHSGKLAGSRMMRAGLIHTFPTLTLCTEKFRKGYRTDTSFGYEQLHRADITNFS
jgi:hypothetical protein